MRIYQFILCGLIGIIFMFSFYDNSNNCKLSDNHKLCKSLCIVRIILFLGIFIS